MPLYLRDAFSLTLGLVETLIAIAFDALNPCRERLRLEQLDDPRVLSQYIGEDVASVAVNTDGVGEGAGGTGTSRRALVATLRDGRVLRLFAKMAAESMTERVFLNQFNIYANEVNFYANISALLSSNQSGGSDAENSWSACPQSYCARKIGRTNFLLILEDPRYRPQGSVFRTVKDKFEVDTGRLVIREYARLHAQFWRCPPKNMWRYCRETGRSLGQTPPYNRFLASEAMKKVRRNWADKVTIYPNCAEAFDLLLANYGTVRAFWSQGPLTLSHGDSHIGNTFFARDMSRGGFVDFQCVSEEHGLRDVAYFLMMSVHPVALARIEEDMLRFYLHELRTALINNGKEEFVADIPSYEEAYFMYRSYSLWVLSAWVICCGFLDVVKDDYIVFALKMTFDTCERLGCLDVVKELIARSKSPVQR